MLLLLTFSLLQQLVVVSKGRDCLLKPTDCLEAPKDQLDTYSLLYSVQLETHPSVLLAGIWRFLVWGKGTKRPQARDSRNSSQRCHTRKRSLLKAHILSTETTLTSFRGHLVSLDLCVFQTCISWHSSTGRLKLLNRFLPSEMVQLLRKDT